MERNATPKWPQLLPLTRLGPKTTKLAIDDDDRRNGHEIERRALGLKMATTLASKPRR